MNARICLNGWRGLKNSNKNYRRAKKPKPCGWIANAAGVVERYDFNDGKISDPPPIDHNTPVIYIYTGYFTPTGAWVSK